MASVCKGLLSSVGKRGLSPLPQILQFPFKCRRSFCNEPSSSNPLLNQLLQLPSSSIKASLDSDDRFALKDAGFQWDSLAAFLPSLSSDKAKLVLEWKLEKMLKENERDYDQYLNLMSLCAKIRNVSLAMHVFTNMEVNGMKPTTSVFNSLIHACLSSNDATTAFSLFEIMVGSEAYKPNAETYETYIIGFSRLGNAVTMKNWYSAKKDAGYPATLQTYEHLISGCVKAGDFDGADEFYEEIASKGLVPNVPVMESLLEGLCRQRRFGQVKEFLKSFLDVGQEISAKMAEKITGLYSKHGKVEEMEELLSAVVESGQAVEVLMQVHSGIIRMYAMLDRLDDVEYSVGRMLKQGLSFRCAGDVEMVISCYFRKEAYDRLEIFLEHINSYVKLTRSTYNLLVSGYRRAGLSERLGLVIKDIEFVGVS